MTKLWFTLSAILFYTAGFSQSADATKSTEKDLASDYALLSSYEWIFNTNNNGHCKVAERKADDTTEKTNEESLSISTVNVFPNPVNACRLNIEFEAEDDSKVFLRVTDLSGNELHSTSIPGKKGELQYQLNMERFDQPFVIVTLIQNDIVVSKKVLLTK